MNFGDNKLPTFIDLDTNIQGTFVRTENSHEQGYVDVFIKPFNMVWGKEIKLPNAVRSSDIFTIDAVSNVPGVERTTKYHFSGKKDGLFSKVFSSMMQTQVEQLRQQIKYLELQSASARQTAQDASVSAEVMVKRASELMKAKNDTQTSNSAQAYGFPSSESGDDPFNKF